MVSLVDEVEVCGLFYFDLENQLTLGCLKAEVVDEEDFRGETRVRLNMFSVRWL